MVFAGNKKKNVDDEMDASETCKLIKFDENQRNTHAQGGTEGDSDEEEDPNGPPESFDYGQDDQDNEDRGVEHAIVDGGCSTAIYSGSEDCLSNYVRTNVSLGTAKAGATLRAIGRGDLSIIVEWKPYGGGKHTRALTLRNTLHCPSAAAHLFGVHAFTSADISVTYRKSRVDFNWTTQGQGLLMRGVKHGKLWRLQFVCINKPIDPPLCLVAKKEEEED